MGGTRFIGIYLARLLTEAGHEVGLHVNQGFSVCNQSGYSIVFKFAMVCCFQVTLFTRGKAPITTQLAEESDEDYKKFASSVSNSYTANPLDAAKQLC